MIFSQTERTLTPTIHLQGTDTLLCFTTDQAKEIAKQLSSGDNCKEQLYQYAVIVEKLDTIITVKNRQIDVLKQKDAICSQMIDEQKKIANGYKTDSEKCDRKLKRNRMLARISTGIAIVFITLTLVK